MGAGAAQLVSRRESLFLSAIAIAYQGNSRGINPGQSHKVEDWERVEVHRRQIG